MEILGRSPELNALLRTLRIAAQTEASLIFLGESGTGKELLAHYVHQHSRRQKWVALNCAALPEALAESELFGHRKGAFTGATQNHIGHIAMAHGGTLFLDEIGEMPLSVQAKLLRFLESGEYYSVGDPHLKKADVRLIAATHHDLKRRVKEGYFRADLYYRLNILPFQVPALRHRSGDIIYLIEKFNHRLAQQYDCAPVDYRPSARKALQKYDWPGNVRELRNLCERLLILFAGQSIEAEQLPLEMQSDNRQSWFQLPPEGISMQELEKNLLQQALQKSRGNQSQAARLLGISRYALIYRLKKYALL